MEGYMGDGSAISGAVVTTGGRVPDRSRIIGIIRALEGGAVYGLHFFTDDADGRKGQKGIIFTEKNPVS
jgi:hypothetical protein